MKLQFITKGEMVYKGFVGYLNEFVKQEQLLDEELWGLFVEQFRSHTDIDNGWRGEYWGKMMRGAVLTYTLTGDEKLYEILYQSVADLLSVQEEDGRISSYPRDRELTGWDMWARKYVLLGCLYFYGVCKDEDFKAKIISSLSRHLDYILSKVGKEEGKLSIFDTSRNYGGLNSCSILEPVVRLYKLTGTKAYLDFAAYIVENGFCKDSNLVELCLLKTTYPAEFAHVKAYEMMSCFQGLLEYYEVTKEEKYFTSAVNFFDLVKESEITIVGSSCCWSEFFYDSFKMQTEKSREVMQETCVTVTWMNFCMKLLQMTGDVKYADCMERSALNAMGGAVNTQRQGALRARVTDGPTGMIDRLPREKLPFDSYSPLYQDRRGRAIGGFNRMANGRSYGCCACIGSAGTALSGLFGVMKNEDSLFVHLYESAEIHTKVGGEQVKLAINADFAKSDCVELIPHGKFTLKLRVPDWSKEFTLFVNGEEVEISKTDGYLCINRNWQGEKVVLKLDTRVKMYRLNGRVAFMKGPYVLARDSRFNDNLNKAICKNKQDKIEAQTFKNTRFDNNVSIRLLAGENTVSLCDYAQAGKNFDEENSIISVWNAFM